MNQKIHLLSETLSNLIAAGEVVERPASVVKELVENAIDASATEIDIEIKDAGQQLIRVSDNGMGMIKEDALLAFSRHATSKVREQDDLNHIMTMGFRGEALPSIASVSKIDLLTCPQQQAIGYEMKLNANKLTSEKEAGRAPGTTISVKDLFYNTPARKKFMKSKTTEQSRITQMTELFAIAQLNISFNYKVDNRVILQCPATAQLKERLAAIYHKALPQELLEVKREAGGIWIYGLIAAPDYVRPTRQGINIFVNNRPVEHRGLTHAVVQAFKTLIPEGKYPVAWLFVEIPPELVDVNVHPAKREVKFQDEAAIFQVMHSAVKTALEQKDLTKKRAGHYLDSITNRSESETIKQSGAQYQRQSLNLGWSSQRIKESIANYYHTRPSMETIKKDQPLAANNKTYTKYENNESNISSRPESSVRIIGQMGRTFIIGEDEQGFFIVDQHAAHERILYESLKSSSDNKMERQPLLLPLTFETNPSQQPLMEKLLSYFDQLGLEISPLGGNTFTIQTRPTALQSADLEAIVREILDYASESNQLPSQNDLQEKMIISMACHSAIKAGQRLQPETMAELIEQINNIKHLPTCPHGRPTIFRLSWDELEKYFKRDYR